MCRSRRFQDSFEPLVHGAVIAFCGPDDAGVLSRVEPGFAVLVDQSSRFDEQVA